MYHINIPALPDYQLRSYLVLSQEAIANAIAANDDNCREFRNLRRFHRKLRAEAELREQRRQRKKLVKAGPSKVWTRCQQHDLMYTDAKRPPAKDRSLEAVRRWLAQG